MNLSYYSYENTRHIFNTRNLIEPPKDLDEFSECAISIVRYEEVYQLNILPVLMSQVIMYPKFQSASACADSIIYALDSTIEGDFYSNPMEVFSGILEVDEMRFFRKWICEISQMPIVNLCPDEYENVRSIWLK